MIFNDILDCVGNTPLINLKLQDFDNINLFAKLEFINPTGSVKDRAASYIIQKVLQLKEIDLNTILVESSSGNFGISLSAYCQKHKLKFICVIDPNISVINENLIKSFGAQIIKIDQPDASGGFLLNRIKKVKELLQQLPNIYWVNQYQNPYNCEAYYATLGNEIVSEMENIDFVFVGVSSGGTITGISQKIKEKFPNAKIIAVDIIGSVIFGGPPKKRYIPGIGSSMKPVILDSAKIDDVVMIDEVSTIEACYELLERYHVFCGGSSGSVIAGIKSYFEKNKINKMTNVVTIFPDRGERYFNTIYNPEWCKNIIDNSNSIKKTHEYVLS
jgi:2,3-diaminopropionate biosynthesis protein SbnA